MGGAATGPRPGESTGSWAPMSIPRAVCNVTSQLRLRVLLTQRSDTCCDLSCQHVSAQWCPAHYCTNLVCPFSRQMSFRPSLAKSSMGGSKDPTVSQTPSLSPRRYTPVREIRAVYMSPQPGGQ